jgi:hypothetical protein
MQAFWLHKMTAVVRWSCHSAKTMYILISECMVGITQKNQLMSAWFCFESRTKTWHSYDFKINWQQLCFYVLLAGHLSKHGCN